MADTTTSPPSTSAAGAGTSIPADLDPVLIHAASNSKDRLQLLKMEQDISTFIRSPLNRLEFPGLNSYQRLILHRLATLFCLDHVVNSHNQANSKSVVLYKNPSSKLSDVKLSDIPLAEETASTPPLDKTAEPVKLLKKRSSKAQRNSAPGNLTHSRPGNGIRNAGEKSMEEREALYQKERAKIFDGMESSLNVSGASNNTENNYNEKQPKVEYRNFQPRPPNEAMYMPQYYDPYQYQPQYHHTSGYSFPGYHPAFISAQQPSYPTQFPYQPPHFTYPAMYPAIQYPFTAHIPPQNPQRMDGESDLSGQMTHDESTTTQPK